MRKVVLAVLYLVVAVSCLYAAAMAFSLVDLWEIKAEIGTIPRNLLTIAAAIVFGAGLPYCMIHFLRKQ